MRLLPLLALLVLLPNALAAHAPADATLAGGAVSAFATDAAGCAGAAPAASFAVGATGLLCVRWNATAVDTANATLELNATAPGLDLTVTNATLALAANLTADAYVGVPFTVPATAAGDLAPTGVLRFARNGTLVEETTVGWHVAIAGAAPPADPDTDWLLLAALAVLLAAGGAGAYAVLRRRQVKAPPRSEAMRQMEAERRLERAKAPEEKAQIQAEIREQETERALSREAQIVEAKIKDVRTGLDRLQERHAAGQLTEHQYRQMRAKREANLEELERELESLRRGE